MTDAERQVLLAAMHLAENMEAVPVPVPLTP